MSVVTNDRQVRTEEPVQAPVAPPSIAPIADPGPLGLACFALTTFVLSVFNAEIVEAELEPVVLPLALFYGGIVQVLAGMWEFRKNNTFGAVAFSSYGAFWIALAAYFRFVVPEFRALPGVQDGSLDISTATGLFLLAWTIFTAYMWVGSFRTNGVLAVLFTVLLGTFILLTIGRLADSDGVFQAGGYLGIFTAFVAWYASAAGVINNTWGRTVLPLFPMKK